MSHRSAAGGSTAGSAEAAFFDEPSRLVGRHRVSPDTVELSFRAPRIAAAARPGQFVNVLLPSAGFGYRVFESAQAWLAAPRPSPLPTLIRRPFSVYRVRASDGGAPDSIDILVKVVGRGTRLLAEMEPESEVSLLGPLGNAFELPPAGATAALVAGGCGWASLGLLARALRDHGHPTYAFIGAATVEALPIDTADGIRPPSFDDLLPEACVTSRELEALGVTVALAAEAGGRVYGGLVTDLLEGFLRRAEGRRLHVYACGPWAMLRTVAELTQAAGAPCQVALEERMGCGLGVCNSCVVEVVLPDGMLGHKKLCTDGPVVNADEVNWAMEKR